MSLNLIARGSTDDVTTCECCGRDDLKATVVMWTVDAEGQPEDLYGYFGSDCAARASGRPAAELRREAKAADEAARAAAAAERSRAAAAEYARREAIWTARYGIADRELIERQTGKSPYAVWLESAE